MKFNYFSFDLLPLIKITTMKKKLSLTFVFLMFAFSPLLFNKCKKPEDKIKKNDSSIYSIQDLLDSEKSTNKASANVSYDQVHDILVFNSFQDVRQLAKSLENYDDNYPFDRGNKDLILETLNNIKLYGFTNAQGNAPTIGNKVNINHFKQLLIESYPLSDDVLKEILITHESINPSFAALFIKDIFEANVPFSREVRDVLSNTSISTGIKNQILAKDENETMVPNYTYNDFLNNFQGFNSFYTTLEELEKTQLESGVIPGDPQFKNNFIKDDFLALILNQSKEVYIGKYLFKLYRDCKWAILTGSISTVYSELALLDNEGQVYPPTLNETSAGLDLSVMNQYVPLNYMVINPSYIELAVDPKTKGESIQFIETSVNKNELCPLSFMSESIDPTNNLLIHFNSFTDLNFQGGTFYQYWNFGDGTGSFQTDPTHIYNDPGVYTVSLTTFNSDCGCWDVKEKNIAIGLSEKACGVYIQNATATKTNTTVGANVYDFSFDIASVGSSSINFIQVDFKDGSAYKIINGYNIVNNHVTFSHTFNHLPPTAQSTYNYTPSVHIEMMDGCVSNENAPFGDLPVTFPEQGCCDRKDKDKNPYPFVFGSNSYKLGISDKIQGNQVLLFFGTRIKASHTFYREKSNGGWKQQKADFHSVSVTGSYNVLVSGECGSEETIFGSWQNPNYKEKTNKKSVNLNFQADGKFGMSLPDMITITHKVVYGSNSEIYYTKFGDC